MATPTEPDILVAKKTALLLYGNTRIAITKGKTTARDGHPALEGREGLFGPLTVDLEYDWADQSNQLQAKPAAPVTQSAAEDAEPAVPETQPDAKAVRAWAAANGVDVPPRGKLPQSAVDQYKAAAQEA